MAQAVHHHTTVLLCLSLTQLLQGYVLLSF